MRTIKAEFVDLSLFLDWMQKRGTLNIKTIKVYYNVIENFLGKNPDIDSIEDYNNFLVSHSVRKRATVTPHALRAFVRFKFAKNRDTMEYLLDGMIPTKRKMDYVVERRYIEPKKLFDVINNLEEEKHRIIALLQMMTGVRAGDIMRLKKGNVMAEDYEGKIVVKMALVGKGGKRNVVYLHDETIQRLLLEYISLNLEENDYYFIRPSTFKDRMNLRFNSDEAKDATTYKMNYEYYRCDLKKALEKIGIEKERFSTHDFRRCFSRRVWEKYKDIYVLKGLLNHADINTTARYLAQSGMKNIEYHKQLQENI